MNTPSGLMLPKAEWAADFILPTQWTMKQCVDQGMQGSDHIELNEINSFLTCGKYAMAEKRSLLVKITWESVCMSLFVLNMQVIVKIPVEDRKLDGVFNFPCEAS